MNWLSALLFAIQLAPGVVTTIQAVHGDSTSGATKKQMAMDALTGALTTALPSLNTQDAALAKLIAVVTGSAINAAVVQTKADGTYQAATVASVAGSTAADVAALKALGQTVPAPKA